MKGTISKMSPFVEKPDWTIATGRPAAPRFGPTGSHSIRKAASSMQQKRIVQSCGSRKMGSERYSPTGTIVPPEFAPGFTFGDSDGKTLYMAASTRLVRIRLK